MPDQEIPTLELSQEVPNAKEANAKVAAELQDQGREPLNVTHIETESLDTQDALAELRAKIQKEKADAAAKAEDEAEPVVEKKVEKPLPTEPVGPAKTGDKPAAVPDKTDDDIFKGISLPPNVKPKSTEAWAALKSKALEEISARDVKLTELEKLVKELEEKSKNPVPDDIHKELEDHRNFRTKFDIEADPKFKAYDKDIADNHAFVYSQLLKTGKVNQETIDLIKKFGGPGKTNLEKVWELVNDPYVQRIVESKIADEEMLRFKKEQAIKETKENVSGYLKEREEAFSKATKSHNEATKTQFVGLTAKMDWTKDREVPKGADDAIKAEIKSHNDFVASTKKDLEAALNDDSPEMRAILLAGMGQLLNLQRVDAVKTQKLATVEKELAEATAKLEKIKGASRSRLPESSAPVGVKVAEVKNDDFSTPTVDALANIRKDILAKRAEKANA